MRAEALLAARRASDAAREYQRIIDARLMTQNGSLGPLARASVMAGDTAKAKAAYQDSFTLWKDADPDPDPDIPILKAAKAEYAKLQ